MDTRSNFIDEVRMYCSSGNGGSGSRHLHRDRLTTRGGPDGGDGGRGGHIIIRGDRNMWTLLPYKYKRHIKAPHGMPGGGSRSSGANGKDIIINVPIGTLIKDEEGTQLCDISEDKQEYLLLEGGKGGRGNWHFRSAVRQTPTYAQGGIEGQEGWFRLELKVLADIGLVGFPNAGKSTLLSCITAATPKIASYAFTTLTPQLGIVKYGDYQSFCIADIPGIIKGASEGKGLGHRFLRHIERNASLLFLISSESEDLNADYTTLLEELEAYSPELITKKRIIALTKVDAIPVEEIEKKMAELQTSHPKIAISSVAGIGLEELTHIMWQTIHSSVESFES